VGAELRIWLLGGFRAAVDGTPVAEEAWRRNKAKALVKLLALARGKRLHREQLMDVLWPDLAPEAAAANLRKAVYFARRALAPEHLALRDEMLRLEAAHLWVDVDAFELAAEAGDLRAAVELYGGDLLPEDRFESWTVERRDQLHARFARRLLDHARELEAAGDPDGATAALERLAVADPLSEEAVMAVIRAHALAGQRHLALRWYRQFEARLDEELGVEPGTEARRLHEDIAAGRFPTAEPAAPPGPPSAADPPAEERKLVTVVLLDVLAPSGAVDPEQARLELDRCAGLVAEVLESWGGTAERLVGGSVLAVFGVPTAHEDDAGRALQAGLELLERAPMPVRAGVGTGEVIAPSGAGADPREIAGVVLDAAARLKEAAEPGTVVADERTRRVAGPGFGRQAGDGLASISLRPLTDGHSRELLDSLTRAGRLPDELGAGVLARAEGNPLFLEELVLHLEGPGTGALPDSLQALLAARIDALPTADKRVLQRAAVVGRVFWEDPVERALGGERVAASLRSLERRGFVVRRPASSLPGQAELAFRHALIHEVAYRSIPKVQRARAHAEVGDWLEELAGGRRDDFAELLAYHFGAAEETAELAWAEPAVRQQVRARAFQHLVQAGAAARRRFAVAKAVELHTQAGSLASTDQERRVVFEELGDDEGSAYHGEEAMAWWALALASARADRTSGADRARLCRKLAWIMASTPGAFRSNPDPVVVDQFVTEGLAAATDELSRAWLLLASRSWSPRPPRR
jgi:DNA-binding SARP family transcriptional activator